MAREIIDINCYGGKFEIDGQFFNLNELKSYCEEQCSDKILKGYRIYFIGMTPTAEIERITQWKRKTLDSLTSK